jgi:NAD(P)-dependent dehydrogenase (short-subunit alcohol dehydrogenase family)
MESKVALITGGYGGMGRASARLFAREGATVFVAGRNHQRGDVLVAEINDAGGKAHFVELDVVNQDHWDAAVARIKEQAGALHVLMNIVGSNALVRFPKSTSSSGTRSSRSTLPAACAVFRPALR